MRFCTWAFVIFVIASRYADKNHILEIAAQTVEDLSERAQFYLRELLYEGI